MKSLCRFLLVVTTAVAVFGQAPAPVAKPARPIPAIEHVVIISVDCLRPDKALQANMTTLLAMMKEGA